MNYFQFTILVCVKWILDAILNRLNLIEFRTGEKTCVVPMFTVCSAHVRSFVGFLQHKWHRSGEKIQRDDVTLWIRNTLSVSRQISLRRDTFFFSYDSFYFFFYYYSSRKNYVQDSNKPLIVPAYCDRFDKIDNVDGTGSIRSMHKFKTLFASHFKQVNEHNNRTTLLNVTKKKNKSILNNVCLVGKRTVGEVFKGLLKLDSLFYLPLRKTCIYRYITFGQISFAQFSKRRDSCPPKLVH